MALFKVCYFPVKNEEDSKKLEHFLKELCGLEFKCYDGPYDLLETHIPVKD